MAMTWRALGLAGLLMLIAACQPAVEEASYLVSLVADGRERAFEYSVPVTIEEFLVDLDIELGDQDRINPPLFTQISDGMRVTIVRVTEEIECIEEEIPYVQQLVPNEGLQADEERLAQSGQNGVQEVCYRILIEDGVPGARSQIGQATILVEPQDEIIYVGADATIEPVPVVGTLAYINNGNAWVINGSSTNKRPLTTDSALDSMVFSLSPDGLYLMYTAAPTDEDMFVNEFWLIHTDGNSDPVQLVPTDVLHAEWKPAVDEEYIISYSTGEVRQIAPYWQALNNLWTMEIDPDNGNTLNIDQIVEESSGGLYGWWGTIFSWSPDGQALAWARADSVGIVGDDGELAPLLTYPVFNTSQPWSWRTTLSWSWDSQLLAATVHGDPVGSEPPENSPAFDIAVTDLAGEFTATVYQAAGMWSAPRFSPALDASSERSVRGYLAYMRAREPYNTVSGAYDMVVADRDGSNARAVFPRADQPGMVTEDFGLTAQDFTWSPDGRQIALVYQGNLWIVDVESGVSHQLTFDGGAEHPVWTQ